MRDPKRIKRICRLIEELWNEPSYQDMRLGQLLENFVFGIKERLWFQEDDLNEEALKLQLAELKREDSSGILHKKRRKKNKVKK